MYIRIPSKEGTYTYEHVYVRVNPLKKIYIAPDVLCPCLHINMLMFTYT